MKRNLLIVIVIVLAVVLLAEIGYITYRSVTATQQGYAENMTTGSQETTGEDSATQTTVGGTGTEIPPVTLPGSGTEGTEPTKAADPSEDTKPAATTKPTESTKPAETTKPTATEPEETIEETRDSGVGENDLPPQPL